MFELSDYTQVANHLREIEVKVRERTNSAERVSIFTTTSTASNKQPIHYDKMIKHLYSLEPFSDLKRVTI